MRPIARASLRLFEDTPTWLLDKLHGLAQRTGIAKAVDQSLTDTTLFTEVGQLIGTLRVAAVADRNRIADRGTPPV